MPCLIQKAPKCVADGTSKTTVFFLSLFIKHEDLTKKSCVYFLFRWFSVENCMFFVLEKMF